jgi:hypothetical protein
LDKGLLGPHTLGGEIGRVALLVFRAIRRP